jgi:hypothetical protein
MKTSDSPGYDLEERTAMFGEAAPLLIHFVHSRDDFQLEAKQRTTDGIHQRMNPWNGAATNRRGWQTWGLLIAGLIWFAISRPLILMRRRLAGADSQVSSIDETNQWFPPAGLVGAFACGCRVGIEFCLNLPFNPVTSSVIKQLVDAGTSVGASYSAPS